ncbi:uS11 family ribosomal protein [Cellulomonas palmilytica]|uniref:hypothetical protein n=1 Tax=Cellulomonas palmilytica TaxID=2608402 RepID=UPI001F3B7C09|nr:hypothetical protein [Cellulomonas palmilytica]UJP39349.1 hypothetical protein F1D97_13540 [Cellulomonas palmilytica]
MPDGTRCIRRPSGTWPSCPCPDCRRIHRRLRKLTELGLLPPSRSQEAWEVVDARLAAEWAPSAIASAAGVPERTIRSALYRRAAGEAASWSRAIAAAILASQPWPTEGSLGAFGLARRLQALAVLGWSADELAARYGVPMMTLSSVRSGRQRRVSADLHARVRAIYDDLSMTPGPGSVATKRALARGWVPPLAWDDDALDDPDGTPAVTGPRPGLHDDVDQTVVAVVLAGQEHATTVAEREHLVPELARRGIPDPEIARLCRTSANTVMRIRHRLGVESRWSA